jgi:pyruvate dehydrogenase E2 component (dihydrolipoamide acetyltransferase)
MEMRVDSLMKLRQSLNEKANGSYKLSVNDFIVKAAALALRKVPEANSSWNEDFIRRFNYVDINVAVNTEKGLFTPLLNDADKMGLVGISNQVRDLAEKAKTGKISPQQLAVSFEYSSFLFLV